VSLIFCSNRDSQFSTAPSQMKFSLANGTISPSFDIRAFATLASSELLGGA